MKNQREIVIELLNKYEEENKSLDDLLNNLTNLNSQEYGFVKTLLYGTVRYKIRLDYIIKKLSKIKFNKIHKSILNILRISLYQIIYMDHIPERAVVNEGVELAKKFGNKGSVGFVNGSLRNFIRNKEKFLKVNLNNELERFSIIYSFPMWLVENIKENYQYYNLEEILNKFNEEAEFGIRINVLKTSKDDFLNEIKKSYNFKDMDHSTNGTVLENPSNIFNTKIYNEGYFYVMSQSSQLVSEMIFKYIKPTKVLDMCAAPGGKITHIYELSKGTGEFLACDISDYKLKLIKENLERLYNSESIKLCKNDGTKINENFIEKFDLVILDAPCSALGLIRKMPEIKYNKKPESLKSLSNMQLKMLNNASKYVLKEGVISYSTCTFTKEENIEVIEKFLMVNKNFELLESRKISPSDFNSDGFSIFILKRID